MNKISYFTSRFTPLKVLVFAVFVPCWLPSNIFQYVSVLSRTACRSWKPDIQEKSTIAMSGIKHNLNYSRDHSTKEGLEYIVSFLRMLYGCFFISLQKRSPCANASERGSPPARNGLCFILSLIPGVSSSSQ